MELPTDFRELLALFNEHGVEYIVVGAHALALHGAPRYTGDLDLYVRPEAANAERVIAALGAFGFGDLGLTAADFTRPEQTIQLGNPPLRIDLITSITGVSWEDAWRGRVAGHLGDQPVGFLGRAEFLENKRATGRAKDLADVASLEGEG